MIRILRQICIMFYHIPFTFSNNLFIFLSELSSNNFAVNLSLTLFKMGTLGVAHRWAGGKKAPLLKVCHTYPTIMTLCTVIPYLKKIPKIYQSRDTFPEFCWLPHFFTRNQQIFVISRNIDIDCILIHDF